jgi:hypothetical protein
MPERISGSSRSGRHYVGAPPKAGTLGGHKRSDFTLITGGIGGSRGTRKNGSGNSNGIMAARSTPSASGMPSRASALIGTRSAIRKLVARIMASGSCADA